MAVMTALSWGWFSATMKSLAKRPVNHIPEANPRAVAFLAQTFVPAVLPALSARIGSALRVEASRQDRLIYYPLASICE